MKDQCAIACWKWKGDRVEFDVYLVSRGPHAIQIVKDMQEAGVEEIKIDTRDVGVFVIGRHDLEFADWCRKKS